MSNTTQNVLGSLVSLWRYPVKSMMGEELNAADAAERGLLGDRAYALVDPSTAKVVSAKYPRKWPNIFEFRAALADTPRVGEKIPPVRITLPNGSIVTSDQRDVSQILSAALGRKVIVKTTAPEGLKFEYHWPDLEGLAYRDTVTEHATPSGTFFDADVLLVLTTATIDRLRELYPQGRFDVRRFRPNIVVEPASGDKGFVENAWVGRTLAIGDEVRLSVTAPCMRCVMTTLPQDDLPRDLGILRTVVQHNDGNVGVRASVLRGGTIRRGDPVRLE